jgi:hypothetical protein
MLGATNYANACQVFCQQWLEWVASGNPILSFLEEHFKACSEEYGESAIHILMSHIREWDYSGPNMQRRWRETSVARSCFEFFSIPPSHRESSTKWFADDQSGELMANVGREFIHACEEVAEESYLTLCPTTGFRDLGDVSYDNRVWHRFLARKESAWIKTAQISLIIRRKLSKPLKEDALRQLIPDSLF